MLLAPLVADPPATALITDFDGTLSPIVTDPSTARPLDGVPELLGRLARRFGVVAVVSGRPAAFLVDRLGGPRGGTAEASGSPVRFFGLYGLEEVGPDGSVALAGVAEPWLAVVAEVADRLGSDAPAGVLVEAKGAAVTVHWRRAPDARGWAAKRIDEEAARSGLVPHLGRSSVELRPPIGIDKGTVTYDLAAGSQAVCYLGDDLGDLPAYAALARLAEERAADVVGVAVRDADTAPEVIAASDLVVDGPTGARAVLEWLEVAASPGPVGQPGA